MVHISYLVSDFPNFINQFNFFEHRYNKHGHEAKKPLTLCTESLVSNYPASVNQAL